MYKNILAFIFTSLIFLTIGRNCSAASIIFQDNFNSETDGSFPSNWKQNDNPGEPHCSVNWHIQSGKVGMPIVNQGSCIRNIAPKDSLWNYSGSQYIYELDAEFIAGSNHNIPYRILPDGQVYELSFSSPGDFVVGGPIKQVNVNVPGAYPNGATYHFEIQVRDLNLKVFIDGILVRDIDWLEQIPPGRMGLRAGTGADPNSTTWYDNIKVTSIDSGPTISVPLLKQTDPLWGSDIYDSANLWTSGGNGMSNWGCAVTSAAMVFQYNALTKMPDNSDLTPGSLNSWLKTQPDGYVRNGLVNWLALSRLSKQAAPVNGVSFDVLEYERVNGPNNTRLDELLAAQNPSILSEPGHFIVATEKDTSNSTYFINDPYHERTSLSDIGYNNNYQAIGSYIPANSDLSYIMLVVNSNINIEVLDPLGDPVGESFIQEAIVDPIGGATNTNGSVNIYYLKKPSSGLYELKLTSSGQANYSLDAFFYDENGNVQKLSSIGSIPNGGVNTFNLDFVKTNSNNSTLQKVEVVTYDSIKQQIIDGYNQKKIKNKITYLALLVELEIAKRTRSAKVSRGALDVMILTIKNDKKIDSVFSASLINNIKILRDSF